MIFLFREIDKQNNFEKQTLSTHPASYKSKVQI